MCENLIQQLLLCELRKNQRGKAFKDFCARVEVTVNEKFLACSQINMTTGQWRFLLDKKDPKKLGDVKLSGATAKRFLSGFDALAEVCTADYKSEFTDLWKLTYTRFKEVIILLESKEHFESEDVDMFQLEVDGFCDLYVGLTGGDGMTNFFHSLCADNFAYFLRKYENLYLLSQ